MSVKSHSTPSVRRELWSDKRLRNVTRKHGRFLKVELVVKEPIEQKTEYKSMKFGKGHYKYIAKYWVKGSKKPHFIGTKSPILVDAPSNSYNRKMLYKRFRAILKKYNKHPRRMRLISTLDTGTGHRVTW